MGCLVELHMKAFHEEVGENQGQWRNHSHTIGLCVVLATETEA